MNLEARKFLEDRGITDDVIDTIGDEDIHLSDVLFEYVKFVKQDNASREDLETRKEKFTKVVRSLMIQASYDSQPIEEFISYWTEHNEKGRKMRFEMQKVFNITRRLATWMRNHKKFNKKDDTNRYNVGQQDYTSKLSDARPGFPLE